MSFFNKYSAKLAGTLQETNSPGFTGTDADGNATGNATGERSEMPRNVSRYAFTFTLQKRRD